MIRGNIFENWNKPCYIARVKEINTDEEGNQIKICYKPEKYSFNIQNASGYLDVTEYGEEVSKVKKAIISMEYNNKIKEGDIAYLDGATPENETEDTYGINGNYIVDSVRPQNLAIAVYFKKLNK